MSNSNEKLIANVAKNVASINTNFATIYKGMPDFRIHGQFLIQFYPWPIGIEIQRLFTPENIGVTENRYKQIFKLTERSLQFLAYCLLIDLWDKKQKFSFKSSDFLKSQLNNFDKPSMGQWLGIIRASFQTYKHNELTKFFDEELIDQSKLITNAEALIQFRNKSYHQYQNSDIEEIELCLAKFLSAIAFLTLFKTVTVRDIKVFYSRFKDPSFKHQYAVLNSNSHNFTSESVDINAFVESHAVLLMRDIHQSSDYLNLFPFVIDTAPYIQLGERGITNGVFVYNGKSHNSLIFAGTHPMDIADFAKWEIGNEIRTQIDQLLQTLLA